MAAEEGDPERGEISGGHSMDSTESRWVFQEDEDASDIEDYDADLRHHHHRQASMLDSEDEDNGEQRLIRTGPRIDSFDVEALEVPGAHRTDYQVVLFNFHSFFPLIWDYCIVVSSIFYLCGSSFFSVKHIR